MPNTSVQQLLLIPYQYILNIQYQIAIMSQYQASSQQVTSVYGIYFCSRCKNMMNPIRANGVLLEFDCQTCGIQQIDFSQRYNEDCLVYTKQLQINSKKHVSNQSHVFDPTMPLVEVNCPECGYNRAIYCVAPDENQTRMVAKMICASIAGTTSKCGYTWLLEDIEQLFQNCVISRTEPIHMQEQGRR